MHDYSTQDGRHFIIRKPDVADAAEIIRYSTLVFASTDQVLTVPEEFTLSVEDEIQWITNINSNPNSLLRVAEMNSVIIGFLFFLHNSKKKLEHTGEFGITVHPEFQGIGIGQKLIEALLSWARQNPQLEKVYLQVFATNDKAIKLYKKLGFMEEGRHRNAAKQLNGEYVDILQLYIETK